MSNTSESLLCGSTLFWDSDLSWNTNLPTLTRCFRRTMFTLAPGAVYWLYLPFHVMGLRNKAKGSSFTWLTAWKLFFAGLLGFISVLDLAFWALDGHFMALDVVEALFRFVTFVSIIFLVKYELSHGARISPFQFFFWLVIVTLHCFNSYCEVIDQVFYESDQMMMVVTSIITTFLMLGSLICHFFSEPKPNYESPSEGDAAEDTKPANENPILSASFPSILAFSWFTGFAWLGCKRSLTFDDLWDLPPDVKSASVVPNYLSKCSPVRRSKSPQPKTKDVKAEFAANGGGLDVKIVDPSGDKHLPSKTPSTVSTLLRTFGPTFAVGSILKFFHDILTFVSPIVLKKIIGYAASDEELWKGILYVLILFFANSIQSVMLSKYFYDMYLIGIWIKSSMTSAIYRKSLRVSPQGKSDSTTGEVVNLMSVDTQRLVDLMPYINMLWSAPLQIALALYFLWGILGPSVLSGLFLMVLLVPVNGAIAAKTRSYQVSQMKFKDARVKSMNEILQGIKIIKLYAWEPSFEAQVGEIRDKEIGILKSLCYLSAGTSFIWSCAPFVVSLVSFATYVLVDEANVLDSQKAFVALALFNILRFPMSMLPMMIAGLVQASVSVKRIDKFMGLSELTESPGASANPGGDEALVMEKASFKWASQDEKDFLKGIDLKIKKNSLVAVVGAVGSGKSSLISAILGEMERSGGRVEINGSLGYCAQQAWIQNATLRDNILFNKKFDKARYQKILESCALVDDLKTLQSGDATEIGEKGINLSGGQKHRVALARVVYNDVDVCLLDDPLSAVDAHVGRHIFDHVIGPEGLLANKTRIFVTHAINYLSRVDEILVMKDGQIAERGTYQELLNQKGPFAEYLVQYLKETTKDDKDESELLDNLETSVHKLEKTLERQESVDSSKHESSERKMSRATRSTSKGADDQPGSKKQYETEKMETGKVSIGVYLYYAQNMGLWLFGGCLALFTVFQVASTASNIWLSHWSDSESLRNVTVTDDTNATSIEDDSLERLNFLGIYGLFGLAQAVSAVIASLLLYLAALRGSMTLHNNMLRNILRSPLTFFDTTPQGRILNRFGKDVDVLDTTMPMIFRGYITCLLAVLATFLVIAYTTPIFLLPISVIMVCYFLVQRVYVATSRQLKRLESVTKSPIYSHFGETLNGTATIRAFKLEADFIRQSEKLVDENQRANYPAIVANRWLAVRLETVGNLIIFCSALLAVLGKGNLSPGLVGLSVSYALSVTQTLNWLVRMASEVETNVVAAERLKEYSETKQEPEWSLESDKSLDSWPAKAVVEFKNVSARYREGLPTVLNDLSFRVEAEQKVGIVGRTGAGKSSVTMCLFRIMDVDQGQILIGDTDIKTIGLHTLRNQLTIIPQDPVLFSGSLRMNLDPFEKHSDDELWQTLKISHLDSFVQTLKEGLQHEISEGGENLSVGQRQLICLARALLRKTKILVLDEATAAVDLETDDLIQATLREAFKDCTVLTIAHRLSTIMDYDKVLVMKEGHAAEFADPKELLADKTTIFYSMCNEASVAKM